MKKLQLINIISICAVLLMFLIIFFSSLGEWKNLGTADDDWIQLGVISLCLIIVSVWYLIISTKFYKSFNEEGKLMKVSFWVNFINLLLIILLLIIGIIVLFQGGDALLGFIIITLFVSYIIIPLFIISFIIFLIAKK